MTFHVLEWDLISVAGWDHLMNVLLALQMGCVLRRLGNDVSSSVSLILCVPVRYVTSYVLHYYQWLTYSDRCSIQLQLGDVNSFFVFFPTL